MLTFLFLLLFLMIKCWETERERQQIPKADATHFGAMNQTLHEITLWLRANRPCPREKSRTCCEGETAHGATWSRKTPQTCRPLWTGGRGAWSGPAEMSHLPELCPGGRPCCSRSICSDKGLSKANFCLLTFSVSAKQGNAMISFPCKTDF